MRIQRRDRFCSYTSTIRSASLYGNPCINAPYTMLNIVVVSPIPSVNAKIATTLRPRCLRRARLPYRTSRAIADIGACGEGERHSLRLRPTLSTTVGFQSGTPLTYFTNGKGGRAGECARVGERRDGLRRERAGTLPPHDCDRCRGVPDWPPRLRAHAHRNAARWLPGARSA